MKFASLALLLLGILFAGCSSDPIRNRPISFSPWRVQETIKYINDRYDRAIDSLEMQPVMVVIHYTAIDSLEASFKYMNNEEMEPGRGVLKNAGRANIAVQFLVAKNGDVYRLMPENHIGRHVIGLNRHAIGIENVGADEQALTPAQVSANAWIVRHLVRKFPIRYLIAHSEYRNFEKTPLWEEREPGYRTEKHDPGESFMAPLRVSVADLGLKSAYDGGEIATRIDYVIGDYHRRNLFNGNALVVQNGQVVFRKSYGNTAESPARPLTPDDRVYLASAAKSITAAAVALLVERKKVSYETGVAAFFPQLRHLLRGVKVKHLLAHTSGLEDYYKLRPAFPGYTNKDALEALQLQTKALHKPGAKFYYANSNYVLLAELVARISKRDFPRFVEENIFRKAGMTGTHFRASPDAPKDAVTSLDAQGKSFSYAYLTAGPGGVDSTVDDMSRFDAALTANTLLSAKSFSTMIHPTTRVETKDTDYAFGWYVYPKQGVIYHDGNFGGYHSMNWLEPRKKNAIVLLANQDTGKIKEITYEIDRVLNGLAATRLK